MNSTSPLQGSRRRPLCLPDILDLRVCDMLPQADTSAATRARDARIDQFDPRSIKRGNQLHQRIDIAPDHTVAGLHALDRWYRKVRQPGHLPLIDIQERARSPELIGSNHECQFSQSERNIIIPCEFWLQASIYRCNVSKRGGLETVIAIGIGGSLATPPLPHHRTYGSVYGGSLD